MKNEPGLLWLSLRHVYSWRHPCMPQPHVPTNTQRLLAYRAAVEPAIGNTYRWPWHDYDNTSLWSPK